jgi:hypothetical protein
VRLTSARSLIGCAYGAWSLQPAARNVAFTPMAEPLFTRAQIVAEIVRCAEENGGVPLGRGRFAAVTGIKESYWLGRYWVRWGDAVREAGFTPNTLNAPLDEAELLQSLATFTLELGRLPTDAELRMRRRQDHTFPSSNTFDRLGRRAERVERLRSFAVTPGFENLHEVLGEPEQPSPEETEELIGQQSETVPGVVYLLRVGRNYKIGRTNEPGRRYREIDLQLPERAERVHVIRTDDAAGIENYWHRRFADRRVNGEWFQLSKADVTAFKRWTKIA